MFAKSYSFNWNGRVENSSYKKPSKTILKTNSQTVIWRNLCSRGIRGVRGISRIIDKNNQITGVTKRL